MKESKEIEFHSTLGSAAIDLLTSSLKKYVFHNWLINNILYFCVT